MYSTYVEKSEVHKTLIATKHKPKQMPKFKIFLEELRPTNDWKIFPYVQHEMRGGLCIHTYVPSHQPLVSKFPFSPFSDSQDFNTISHI